MRPTRRRPVYACSRPDTFKYFLDPARVHGTWARLEAEFGEAREVAGFRLRELSGPRVLIRAPHVGNPITVFRTVGCTAADIAELHRLLEFEERD